MNKYRALITLSLIGTVLVGCDNSKNDTNKQQLANDIVNSMVTVKGGRFQMGDFGPLVGEKLPFSPG
ncbi:TPA: hypothetical protein ACGEY9_002272, partial [Escherichia coli]|nr:hypothetical protein [Escherichia coli O8]